MEITTANEYTNKREKVVQLPSGAVFKIRKLSAFDFIKDGEIPRFMKQVNKSSDKTKVLDTMSDKDKAEALELLTKVVCAGTVEPNVVDKPADECTDNELSINTVDDSDKKYLLEQIVSMTSMTSQDMDVIEKFPGGKVSKDSGPDSKKIRDPTHTSDSA